MSTRRLLQVRRAERDALLRRLMDQLDKDAHIAAAWLAGSDEAVPDDLSDIDLWLAVADEHCQARIAQRREYVAGVARPLLVEEPPEGAPQDGAYLLVLYAGQAGPHQVHWRWLPRSRARLPQGVRLLVDRGGVLPAAPPGPLTRRQRAQMAGAQTMLFWAMVHGAAQCVARRDPWQALAMIGRAREALEGVRAFAGGGAPPGDVETGDLPALSPCRQMAILRALAKDMEGLTPQVAQLGASVPVQAIIQIQRFLDLAEALSSEPAEGLAVAGSHVAQ